AVPVYIDMERSSIDAARMGSSMMLSLQAMAARFGGSVSKVEVQGRARASVSGRVIAGSQWIGERAFAPVNEAAEAFGFGVVEASAERIDLQRARVVNVSGARLDVTAYPASRWLLLPVQDIAQLYGVPVAWDAELGAVRLDGRPIFGVELIGNKAYLP